MREFHMAHATCRLRSVDPASILWMEPRTTRSGVDHRFCTNCTANQLDSSTAYLILEHLVAERFPFPAPKLSSCEGVVGFSLLVPNSKEAPSVGQSGERRCGILVSMFTQWGCYRFRWRRNSYKLSSRISGDGWGRRGFIWTHEKAFECGFILSVKHTSESLGISGGSRITFWARGNS